MQDKSLIVFYDGFCPLCLAEMSKLKKFDKHKVIDFVDIQGESFRIEYPELEWRALNARIHGYLANGTLISGLDVTYLAWKLVGKGWVYAPLRWPVIKWFADKAYNGFAKHRYSISFLLTGKKRCLPCEQSVERSTNER